MDSRHHPDDRCDHYCDPDSGRHHAYDPATSTHRWWNDPASPDDPGVDVSGWTPLGAIEDGGVFVAPPGTAVPLDGRPWLERYGELCERYPELPQRTGWEPLHTSPSVIELQPGEGVLTNTAAQDRITAAIELLARVTGQSVEDVRAAIDTAASFDDTGRRVRKAGQGYRVSSQIMDELGSWEQPAGQPDELHRVAAKYLEQP